jgi:hypothetical protein
VRGLNTVSGVECEWVRGDARTVHQRRVSRPNYFDWRRPFPRRGHGVRCASSSREESTRLENALIEAASMAGVGRVHRQSRLGDC